ncbi:MAG: hypothetical protein IJU98_04855, partial [Synergistaceae bacterium]|nr:hypothetical protein [Synergistaceae bacterium]
LFIARSFRMNKEKYSYAFTTNSTRLKKQTIMLPIDASGQPDWDYMERYVKQKVYALQRQYLQRKLEGGTEEK